ncbi:LegC family aminotransferase [Thiomicrorhabdus sp. ZW0627]|uniref:LegC family aminotransferase n=1 Tax=Thiomicrorhabdus sp. ZW0627 TaxID=3039774 RepID=UPI00243721D9|nr:LegC family aminotransferase [Thiomicrorhabdus sp. ZW0627]MDG6773365.1 LegC family aminotransferase [Thiomicrorhabdus sp. ZW0627]
MSEAFSATYPETQKIIQAIRTHYHTDDFIPLHAPCLGEPEKQTLNDCIDSTFVSSVGRYVDEFEQIMADFTDANHAVAVVNGTMGLFLGLKVVGVQPGDLILTQSLTFVATANAIKMLQADPVFLDVDANSYGLSADSLQEFLGEQTCLIDGQCVHSRTGRVIRACVPMHTLGFACEIDRIVEICHKHNIKVVEDAAESLGSYYQGQHTGIFGDVGVFSFNGNKILTTGGGGMLVTNNEALAKHAKHLSTTAKIPHAWLFEHDEIAYNLRMPNLNAALGVAQFSRLQDFLEEKRALAEMYRSLGEKLTGLSVMDGLEAGLPNYWLNGIVFHDPAQRDRFLAESNEEGIQTRPLWTPMHKLEIYQDCLRGDLDQTEWLAERVVNLPSGVKCNG